MAQLPKQTAKQRKCQTALNAEERNAEGRFLLVRPLASAPFGICAVPQSTPASQFA
jgi:hypothetical protein